jgi:hypothetical protein
MTTLGDWLLLACFGALLFLAGCAAPEPIAPEKVAIPIPVSCLPDDLPPPPKATSDAELAKMTPRRRYLSIAADREAASEWLIRWGPAIDACRK